MTTFFCNNKMLEESVRTLYIQLLNTYIYIYIKSLRNHNAFDTYHCITTNITNRNCR